MRLQPVSGGERASQRKAIVAGMVGNLLEWYDFAAYGFLASIFAVNFFPQNDPFIALVASFGVFAASFLTRPIGGILFGHVADRYGRRPALYLSSGLMTVSTVAIAFLPTYQMVGAVAPVLLVLMRVMQGISVGGEYTTASVFLAEQAHRGRRGFATSLVTAGCNGGLLLGSCVAAITAAVMPYADLIAWGWRLPFAGGVLLGAFVIVMRQSLIHDRPAEQGDGRLPIVRAVQEEGGKILIAGSACLVLGIYFYIMFVYLVTLMHQVDGFTDHVAFLINTASICMVLVFSLVFGWLSDRLGRKAVQVTGLALLLVLAIPLFHWIASPSPLKVLCAQMVLTLVFAAYAGPMPAMMAETFGKATRCSALSLCWNVSIGAIGGLSPMLAVFLLHEYRTPQALAYLIVGLGLVSLVSLLFMKDRTREPL